MPRILTTLILLTFINKSFPQSPIEQYVKRSITAITSINPDSTNFADLEPIGQAIGDKRIVMLGEQDHGDAPAFLAKTRILKYLHEKKGFDILAFESDFFGLTTAGKEYKQNRTTLDSLILKNVYPIWTYCDACIPLFKQYIPATQQTSNPIELAGFDCQFSSPYLFARLDSQLKARDIQIFPPLHNWYSHTKDSLYEKCLGYLGSVRGQISDPNDKEGFWPLVIDNISATIREFHYQNVDYWQFMNIRDSQMAANLKWLTEVKYRGKKIVVWAHNHHISKYAGHFPEKFRNDASTMGTFYTADPAMLDQTYILGFSSYQGKAGRLAKKRTIYEIPPPAKNTFEDWLKGYNFAFVDFRPYNGQENFNLAGAVVGNDYHKPHAGPWTRIFDGIFFIKDMYPCNDTK